MSKLDQLIRYIKDCKGKIFIDPDTIIVIYSLIADNFITIVMSPDNTYNIEDCLSQIWDEIYKENE